MIGQAFQIQDDELGIWGDPAVTGKSAATDITTRKQAEDKLQLAANVFASAREGIIITDAQGLIIDVNGAFTQITGYSRAEALGQNPRMLSSGRQDKNLYERMWQSLLEQGHWSGELWNRHVTPRASPSSMWACSRTSPP